MNRTSKPSISINRITHHLGYSRGKLFGFLIIGALLAFELFNYSTTDFALNDLLGGLRFFGVRWVTILAIAFCGIDFAGIARLFTPERGANEPKEVWYLCTAWLLAASMNAMLTWWGVALAIVNHNSIGDSFVNHQTLLNVVPIFVAIMVWLIRVLIIGTFSVAGDRIYMQSDSINRPRPAPVLNPSDAVVRSPQTAPLNFRPIPKATPQSEHRPVSHPNPTYHPAGMTGYKIGDHQTRR